MFKKNINKIIVIFIVLYTNCSLAKMNINIQRGSNKNITIAILGFINNQNMDITSVVSNDFNSCDGFKILEEKKYPESIDINSIPKFNAWRIVGVDAVLIGEIQEKNNEYELIYRVWDTVMKKQLSGKSISITKENWRRVAHIISDNIYHVFTGDKGHFDTRIAYVAETGSYTKKVKRLAIMDYDGANHHYLTDGSNMILTPRFSFDGEKIIYMTYIKDIARLNIRNIKTGEEKAIGDFNGITSSPRFSPEGDSVVMAISDKGSTNIFSASLKNSRVRQLTKYNAISTSPSFSPNGKQIVFVSDRSGTTQLYIMNIDGSGVKRITFGNGSYSAPSWSPRGDYIAFTKSYGGNFFIGVIHPSGNGERLLTKGYMVESANWSPNGRMIIFARQEKIGFQNSRTKNKIFSLDIVSGKERVLPTTSEATDPIWSPFLR